MICFLFIPVHWLFFAASTYVWVQYVWHTERGICLPTVSLWLLFVYIEASVRLRELKNLPFHLDLCRPFAAHWYGFPFLFELIIEGIPLPLQYWLSSGDVRLRIQVLRQLPNEVKETERSGQRK